MYKIDFNYGLGALPVSLFIKLSTPTNISDIGVSLKIDIFKIWDDIQKYNCRDIIFYGDIKPNIDLLRFLNNSLIGSGFHVSVIVPQDLLLMAGDISANSIIIFCDLNIIKKQNIKLLKHFQPNDKLVFTDSNIERLGFFRNNLLEKNIQMKTFATCSEEDLLQAKIYDVFTYTGEINEYQTQT